LVRDLVEAMGIFDLSVMGVVRWYARLPILMHYSQVAIDVLAVSIIAILEDSVAIHSAVSVTVEATDVHCSPLAIFKSGDLLGTAAAFVQPVRRFMGVRFDRGVLRGVLSGKSSGGGSRGHCGWNDCDGVFEEGRSLFNT
jgi:hypothetical protein